MKKLILIFAIFFLVSATGFAQPFAKASHGINVGMGIGNTNYYGHSYYYGFYPSFQASYEYGIVEIPMGSTLVGVISAGGYVGYTFSKTRYSYWSSDDYYLTTNLIIAARGNYHFIFHDQLDTYAGVWFGADIAGSKWKGSGSDPDVDFVSSGPAGGAYAGARWFFNDNIAVYSEIGWLITIFNFGVTFKID